MYFLSEDTILHFPHPLAARTDGLLAVGGNLTVSRLILSYRFGIFPWYSKEQPVLWWFPPERFLINLPDFHIPKSMRKYINQKIFEITVDSHFEYVIDQCQNIPRPNQNGTWITDEMKASYIRLHRMGIAHSIEVWHDGRIAGGLYGVGVGKIFSGESMFSTVSDASKYAVIVLREILAEKGYRLLDCQQYSRHMELFGGQTISSDLYFELIRSNLKNPLRPEKWNPPVKRLSIS